MQLVVKYFRNVTKQGCSFCAAKIDANVGVAKSFRSRASAFAIAAGNVLLVREPVMSKPALYLIGMWRRAASGATNDKEAASGFSLSIFGANTGRLAIEVLATDCFANRGSCSLLDNLSAAHFTAKQRSMLSCLAT